MSKFFYDYDDGEFVHTASNNIAYNFNGDMLVRINNNMAWDMDSGDFHFISGWSEYEDD